MSSTENHCLLSFWQVPSRCMKLDDLQEYAALLNVLLGMIHNKLRRKLICGRRKVTKDNCWSTEGVADADL